MPIPIDTGIYERAKDIADRTYSKPSAYKSGFIVKTYKELGGRYKEDNKEKNLKRWFEEKWKSVNQTGYPVFRPTVKVSKNTPLLASEINPMDLKMKIKLKQKIKGKSNLAPFIPAIFL